MVYRKYLFSHNLWINPGLYMEEVGFMDVVGYEDKSGCVNSVIQ